MKKITKRLIALLLMGVMMLSCLTPVTAEGTDTSALGALADSYETQSGTFSLTTDSRFFVVSDSEPTGNLLQTVQLAQTQFAAEGRPSTNTLDIVWGDVELAKDGDIVVKLDTSSGTGTEGYKLDVSGKAIVTAEDVDGLLYGFNMLQKYMRNANSNTLSGFTASDTPDTKERTVSLDCGRKYYSPEWICNFIREMSWMGYNTLELHFSEDGGFRADFWDEKYYTTGFQPENDFSWLCGSKVQYWVYNGNKTNTSYPYSTDPDAGKYLTTSELIQIINVAKEYHIDIIPAFDSPAHMDYITWKFEQNYKSNTSYSFDYNGTTYKASSNSGCINYTGTTGESSPNWYYAAVDITENTMAEAFVLALYEDIADFFKVYAGSTDFSIGADEVGQGGSVVWTYADDFPVYINKLNGILNNKGYTMRMFNDFIGTTAYSTDLSFDSNIEIMYWDSPFNPNTGESGTSTQPASYFVNEGRTIYNCIQTHTYYVLRVANTSKVSSAYKYMDARNPSNKNWTFYHSTEDLIYNEWKPNNVSEKGTYSESVADIPSNQLGGGYFLIWNDYAALSTESEVWEGAPDNTGTASGNTYSLLNRMWSNTIKMWNSDINNTDNVTYSEFAAVRDTFGHFPGYTSCSADAYLPDATSPKQAVDFRKLEAALSEKLEQGNYTDASYQKYLEAYAAAEAINGSDDVTQEQIDACVSALQTARKALTEKEETDDTENEANVTIQLKTKVNGVETNITSIGVYVPNSSSQIYLEPLTGYKYSSIEGGTFTPLASGDGSGYISGITSSSVTVWYENTPSTSRLSDVISEEITEQGSYTQDSWTAYQNALQKAKDYLAAVNASTMQSSIDEIVAELCTARSQLITESTDTQIISVGKLATTFKKGKQVGLKVTTTPDVVTMSVKDQTLNLCTGKVQTLSTGETVKIWLVYFDATATGTYTLTAGTATMDVEVVVK